MLELVNNMQLIYQKLTNRKVLLGQSYVNRKMIYNKSRITVNKIYLAMAKREGYLSLRIMTISKRNIARVERKLQLS